ncbi:hypothetical protein D0862_14788 [Hortaea werneckii]|uniref:Uncharacterized protein n=1 Tax=Hortaea werneckii TaxID=91943 RepID=A0A3M7E134_HORWE|nr:hypothetical protein D0862_14788 [Hortaea werneckii]
MPAPRFWQFAHLTDSTKDMGWLDRIPRATTGLLPADSSSSGVDGGGGGRGNLYIGGLHGLYSHPHLLREAKVSHVLSVIDFDLSTDEGNGKVQAGGEGGGKSGDGGGGGVLEGYQHLMIREDDEPNANLLQHFERTNDFIEEGLRDGKGGGVFVHCAMGKSRSATVCCAYLMWKYDLAPQEALRWVCEGRAVCSPNPGFMEQLGVWRRMLDVQDRVGRERV